MRSGRRLAFDYGQVRIGVAVSDLSGLIATPVGNLVAQDQSLDQKLKLMVEEYEPIYMVVGEPRHLSGGSNPSLIAAHAFGQHLVQLFEIPVHFIDERMSTVNASKNLQRSGQNSKTSKELIDAMAAAMILESALERERIAGHLD